MKILISFKGIHVESLTTSEISFEYPLPPSPPHRSLSSSMLSRGEDLKTQEVIFHLKVRVSTSCCSGMESSCITSTFCFHHMRNSHNNTARHIITTKQFPMVPDITASLSASGQNIIRWNKKYTLSKVKD